MRLSYNAPVVLTFTLLAAAVLVANTLVGGWLIPFFFSTGTLLTPLAPLTGFFAIFTHILGHANWQHFVGNFMPILLVGPLLEEKYGSSRLFTMIMMTAAATGIINALFFGMAIMGASGIVFMMLILASFASVRKVQKGEIPVTFVLAAVLYIGSEILQSGQDDHIAHMAHIFGGACGGLFGMWYAPRNRNGNHEP